MLPFEPRTAIPPSDAATAAAIMGGIETDCAKEHPCERKSAAATATRETKINLRQLSMSAASSSMSSSRRTTLSDTDRRVSRHPKSMARRISANPNLMDAWLSSGLARSATGEWEVAIDYFARAVRLSPFDPMLFLMQFGAGSGHFQTGRYEEAAAWAAKSIGEYPKYLPAWRLAAASNGLLARKEQAQKAVAGLLQLDPTLRLANLKDRAISFRRPGDLDRLEEGLRRAGVPE